MHKFDDYNGFSTSLDSIPFGPNYVYTATRRLISIISAVTDIIKTVFNVNTLVRYCINYLSGRNIPVGVKKFRKFLLFDPDIIVMKALEATTQIGGFNQHLPIQQSRERFLYSDPHRH